MYCLNYSSILFIANKGETETVKCITASLRSLSFCFTVMNKTIYLFNVYELPLEI